MGKTLETNPFNLNVKKLDQSGFNINPLFSKMAAAFDEVLFFLGFFNFTKILTIFFPFVFFFKFFQTRAGQRDCCWDS